MKTKKFTLLENLYRFFFIARINNIFRSSWDDYEECHKLDKEFGYRWNSHDTLQAMKGYDLKEFFPDKGLLKSVMYQDLISFFELKVLESELDICDIPSYQKIYKKLTVEEKKDSAWKERPDIFYEDLYYKNDLYGVNDFDTLSLGFYKNAFILNIIPDDEKAYLKVRDSLPDEEKRKWPKKKLVSLYGTEKMEGFYISTSFVKGQVVKEVQKQKKDDPDELKYKTLEKKIEKYSNNNEFLRGKIKSLKEELRVLKENIKNLKASSSTKEKESVFKEEIQRLRKEMSKLKSLNKKLNDSVVELEILKNNILKLEEKLDSFKEKNKILNRKNINLLNKNNKFKVEIDKEKNNSMLKEGLLRKENEPEIKVLQEEKIKERNIAEKNKYAKSNSSKSQFFPSNYFV